MRPSSVLRDNSPTSAGPRRPSRCYWPALYVIDGRGRVRHRHFSEGDYEQSERGIRELLAEVGARGIGQNRASGHSRRCRGGCRLGQPKPLETYLGSDRGENGVTSGARLRLNQWAVEGDWTVQRQPAVLNQADGRIAYRFQARDLNRVTSPAVGGKPVRFRVLIDGNAPGSAHGIDVNEHGDGTVTEPRMYQLVQQPGPVADRKFEIQFLDPDVEVFVLTFG
jgi:hypothetical protein